MIMELMDDFQAKRKPTRRLLGAVAVVAALFLGGGYAVMAATESCGADVCVGDSWQAAYAAAAPGTVLTVQAGTYSGQAFSRVAGRARGAAVVFRPAGGTVTVGGALSSGISGGSVTTPTGATDIELDDITVNGEVALKWGSNGWRLVNVRAANLRLTSVDGVTVQTSEFGPFVDQVATINSAGGSSPGATNILIENSYFHDYVISDPAKHAECMQIWPSAASSNIVIRNTDFRNCTDFGVLVKAPNLTGLVFDTVRLDEPQPGNVATVTCNPNCPRSGSSIRFSSYAYPGGKVMDSRMAGSLSIDVAGNVAVTNTCSKCDPGPVLGGIASSPPPPPPVCPGSTLPLTVVAQDATTVTFGWTPPATVQWYLFFTSATTSFADAKRVSNAAAVDANGVQKTTVKFAKGSVCYFVKALGPLADGGSPG